MQSKESWEMSDSEKVEAAQVKKDKAAAYFKAVSAHTCLVMTHTFNTVGGILLRASIDPLISHVMPT